MPTRSPAVVGNDTFQDTVAGLNGDTITDFSAGDKIVITNASLSGLTFSVSGTTLTINSSSGTAVVHLGAAPNGTISASAASGGGVQLALTSMQAAVSYAGDFNGDGRADILLRNDDGTMTDWLGQTNGGFAWNSNASSGLNNTWHVAGVGDFNGDTRADVLLRDDDGTITEWLGQANGGFAWNSNASYGLNNTWHVAGVGDFNGDTRADVLLRNDDGTITSGSVRPMVVLPGIRMRATVSTTPGMSPASETSMATRAPTCSCAMMTARSPSGSVRPIGGFVWNSSASYGLNNAWHVAGVGDSMAILDPTCCCATMTARSPVARSGQWRVRLEFECKLRSQQRVACRRCWRLQWRYSRRCAAAQR